MSDAMQSEQINELAGALALAQAEIQPAAKDRENPFYKSSYATLDSVWAVIRGPLSKYGLSVVQAPRILEDKSLVLETTLLHKSGQWIRGRYPIEPVKRDPQGLGSATTYSRRYALAAMVGVVADEDDDGNAASRPSNEIPAKRKPAAPSGAPASGHGARRATPAGEPSRDGGVPLAAVNEAQAKAIEAYRAELGTAATLDEVKKSAGEIAREPEAVKAALKADYAAAVARLKASNGAAHP